MIEEKPNDKIEEDILMDSIEIKNEFENEENKLKTQVGQTLPQRVRKIKLIVKKLKKSRKNFKRNKHVEIE